MSIYVIANHLKSFNDINKLELSTALKNEIKTVRKDIEIDLDPTGELHQRRIELHMKTPGCGCPENYIDVTLNYSKYYFADEPEKCACLSNCPYIEYFPNEGEGKNLCRECADEIYERQEDQINFFEVDKCYDHDKRYGVGLKLVRVEEKFEAANDFTHSLAIDDGYYCDNCMCTLWEVTINKNCTCEFVCNEIESSSSSSEDEDRSIHYESDY